MHVYPIARGIAPPLVALGAWLMAGESPGPIGALAILLTRCDREPRLRPGWRLGPLRPVWFALATGLGIAGYTICDGLGGRLAGDVLGYIAWLFVLDAVPFGLIVAFWRRHDLAGQLRASGGAPVLAACSPWPPMGCDLGDEPGTHGKRLGAARDQRDHRGADRHAPLWEPFGTRRVVAAGVVALGVILLEAGLTGDGHSRAAIGEAWGATWGI